MLKKMNQSPLGIKIINIFTLDILKKHELEGTKSPLFVSTNLNDFGSTNRKNSCR